MKLPRRRDWLPAPEESYVSIDGLATAAASIVVALLQRVWPDDEKRDLELQRMELENEKLRAEIEVLRSVDVSSSGAASSDEPSTDDGRTDG